MSQAKENVGHHAAAVRPAVPAVAAAGGSCFVPTSSTRRSTSRSTIYLSLVQVWCDDKKLAHGACS